MGESNGTVAPGFEGVREAFEKNFSDGLEIGASFGAYHHGEKVVDLWGGVADQATGRAWDERTLALVFSTTKGVTAVCANKLAQDGMLDMDAPVARYWPEFAAGGKVGAFGIPDVKMKFAAEALGATHGRDGKKEQGCEQRKEAAAGMRRMRHRLRNRIDPGRRENA